jgi:hypothetical protein
MDEKTKRLINPKPDWLERASQPSELGIKERAMFVAIVVLGLVTLGCAAAFVLLR